jgi:glutaminase
MVARDQRRGNSKLGMTALERLSQRTGWSVFEAAAD